LSFLMKFSIEAREGNFYFRVFLKTLIWFPQVPTVLWISHTIFCGLSQSPPIRFPKLSSFLFPKKKTAFKKVLISDYDKKIETCIFQKRKLCVMKRYQKNSVM
jgi:hypothetical protein